MLIPCVTSYVREYSMETLAKMTGVSRQSIHNLINKNNPTFKKSTLDKLYNFFHLYKDEFYLQNLKRQYQDGPSYLARILQNKRLSLGMSRNELSRTSKISEKTISRIERGSIPEKTTLEFLLKALDFTKEEQCIIVSFSKHLKVLVDLHNKYSI